MSAAGGMAPFVTRFYHHLANKLSKKWSLYKEHLSDQVLSQLLRIYCNWLFASFMDFVPQPVIQHVHEEVCLRVLMLSCSMVTSMADLIEGIFAFVFSFSFSFIACFHIFIYQLIILLIVLLYFSSLIVLFNYSFKKNYESSALSIIVQ